MFREINVAGFVLKNGWVFCQITFLIYMIILAVMDIKRRQVHLGFLGFWSLMSVLFMAFFMAGLFSVIMLLKTKFHKKSKFPFIPFLMAAYAGGIILNGY